MNSLLNKMERKFGRYAISNLSLYIVIAYVIGYILSLTGTLDFLRLDPYLILKGQVWRIVTWIIVPPSSLGIFTIIMLFFYYSLGTNLERTWGTFRYNIYIFGGMFFTLLGAFILFVLYAIVLKQPADTVGMIVGYSFSTYYINMSIFLAFATMYPNMQVLLYFIIPIKMKWMAIVYAFFIVLTMIQGSFATRVAVIMSLLNYIIFFLGTRNFKSISPKEVKRRADFRNAVNSARTATYTTSRTNATGEVKKVITKHKCAICGRTELDGDHLEFRFCSKCNGNYEYCNDHLFTHTHKE